MNNNVSISWSLDKRRKKSNGKFPLKICVYQKHPKIQKYFPTKYEYTKQEFEEIMFPLEGKREKREIINQRDELATAKKRVIDVADKIVPFDFDVFKKKLYVTESQESNVFYQYDLYINKLLNEGRIKTANANYDCSKKALMDFLKYKNIKIDFLDFRSVSVQFLFDFERYFLEIKKGSISTVGAYLRPLKAIFNIAIQESIITDNYYPFGKNKYTIPSSLRVKKAYSKDEVKILYNAIPMTKEQEMAKDFWFFSYMCHGLNGKDICMLRFENIINDTIFINRAKTTRRIRTNKKSLIIPLTQDALKIIEKYAIKSNIKSDFVFGKLTDKMTEVEKAKKIDAFNRFISQHISKLAKSVGLDSDISSIWARHSFATILIRERGYLTEAMECLGHTSMKTTEAYFSGFASDTLKEITENSMNFN